MSRGRLARYALWQLRDFVWERGLPTLIVGALLLWPIITGVRLMTLPGDRMPDTLLRTLLPQVVGPLAFLGTIMATSSIVSRDRARGYYRLSFAKPVGIVAFYAQLFVLHGVGLCAAAGIVLAAFALGVGGSYPAAALLHVALMYVALGGVVFLASTLVRFDWVLAGGIWGAALGLYAMEQMGARWAARLAPFLPQAGRSDEVARALVVGGELDVALVAHLLGYGAVCFLLGLVVLRRRPMGR